MSFYKKGYLKIILIITIFFLISSSFILISKFLLNREKDFVFSNNDSMRIEKFSENKVLSDDVNVKINGKEELGKFQWDIKGFVKYIEGDLEIDNEKYDLRISNFKRATDNIYYGFASKNYEEFYPDLTVYFNKETNLFMLIDEEDNSAVINNHNIENYNYYQLLEAVYEF
ncbi:MAG: hypothetical protein ACRDD2_10405 [Sarcina sp.]